MTKKDTILCSERGHNKGKRSLLGGFVLLCFLPVRDFFLYHLVFFDGMQNPVLYYLKGGCGLKEEVLGLQTKNLGMSPIFAS